MKKLLLILLLLPMIGFSQNYILDSIAENGGYTYKAFPIGQGPFPAVLYSHGGLGGQIGGDLRQTCIALAQAGYISWCQLRTDTIPFPPHIIQVEASLDSLLNQNNVDLNNIGIIGFSRGGLLTLTTAISHYNYVHAIVTMAPAAANNYLSNTLNQVSVVDDSVLVLVAENDLYQDNHVQLAQDVYYALDTVTGVRYIEYDSYDSDGNGIINNLDDGHELFWEVQQPYWSDLIQFLDNNLKYNTTDITYSVLSKAKNLIKIIDLLGKETKEKKNQLLFYLYDDGTVEKRITVE